MAASNYITHTKHVEHGLKSTVVEKKEYICSCENLINLLTIN